MIRPTGPNADLRQPDDAREREFTRPLRKFQPETQALIRHLLQIGDITDIIQNGELRLRALHGGRSVPPAYVYGGAVRGYELRDIEIPDADRSGAYRRCRLTAINFHMRRGPTIRGRSSRTSARLEHCHDQGPDRQLGNRHGT